LNRRELITALKNYTTPYEHEQKFATSFLQLLQHPDAYQRSHLPGHITGSAWIIDESRENVLLTHHAKLNRWLQPGGHADGNEDIFEVALREAVEETGLTSLRLINPSFFDIDIHVIPARKEFPEHDHYDVRFLFEAKRTDSLVVSEESHDLAWININNLMTTTGKNDSILRMAEKVSTLFRSQQ